MASFSSAVHAVVPGEVNGKLWCPVFLKMQAPNGGYRIYGFNFMFLGLKASLKLMETVRMIHVESNHVTVILGFLKNRKALFCTEN